MNNSSSIIKVFVAIFSLVAALTLFLTWVRIELPYIGTVYELPGLKITGYIPIVSLSITTILFIIYSFIPIRRVVSVMTAFINLIPLILIPIRLSKISDQDTYVKFIENTSWISWVDNLVGTDLYSFVVEAVKYDFVVYFTLIMILLSIVCSFFVNDR